MSNIKMTSLYSTFSISVFYLLLFLLMGCNKIELPDPDIKSDKVFSLGGFLNGQKIGFDTETHKMITDLFVDSLGVRVFKTSFEATDGSGERFVFFIRDSRIFEEDQNIQNILLPGNYPTYDYNAFTGRSFVLRNTLDSEDIGGLVWRYEGQELAGGTEFNIERVNPNRTYRICLLNPINYDNSFSSYCKTFVPGHLKDKFDISIDGFEINGNAIRPKVAAGTCCNLFYRWNSTNINDHGNYVVMENGKHRLVVEGKNDHQTEVDLFLNLYNEELIHPVFTGFSSTLEEWQSVPNFSTSALYYENGMGEVFSSAASGIQGSGLLKVITSDNEFLINDIGKKVKKVSVQFDGPLFSPSGDSIIVKELRGTLGFTVE
jgi:hypothetical protein